MDGFPRTMNQAQKLDELLEQKGIPVDKAFHLSLKQQTALNRLTGRWVHHPSGRTYHLVYNPPVRGLKDDITGEQLDQREDDKPDIVIKRFEEFNQFTLPVMQYYRDKGILVELDGDRPVHSIWRDIKKVFQL